MTFASFLLAAAATTLAVSSVGAMASPIAQRTFNPNQFSLNITTLDGSAIFGAYGTQVFPYPANIRAAEGSTTPGTFSMYTLTCSPYYGIFTDSDHGLVDGWKAENGRIGFANPIGSADPSPILGYGHKNVYNASALSFDSGNRLVIEGKSQFAACAGSPIAGVFNIRWFADDSGFENARCTKVDIYKVAP